MTLLDKSSVSGKMHSELYEVTATVTLGVWVLVCSLFVYWLRDFKENPDTRKQCPSDTTRIAQEENDERRRSQPTLFLSSDDQLSKRKRRFKRRRKRKQNLNASVAVECNVPVTPQDFQPVASDDNQFSTSRKGSYCCQELDMESQKGQPHVQAVLQNNEHDWKTISAALAYLHKHNALERVAKTVLKAIQHMQDLVKVPGRGYTEYMGYKIPNDYSQTELWDIVLVQCGDMTRVEFEWVHREFVQSHGYPPTPYEFSKLYEKCIETEKLRKYVDKLRKNEDENERRLVNERQISKEMRKENNILKSRVVHLEGLVSRALCKICLFNEVAVLYQPCDHALVCRSCHERSIAGKSKRARTCSICNCHIKTTKNLILA